MNRIIFKNKDNSIGILVPTDEALNFATIEQIAEKDVPYRLPYKIVEDSFILTDRTYRDAWQWDNAWNPDGFGGESNEFNEELLKKYYNIKEWQ